MSHTARRKTQITIRIEQKTLRYFKKLAYTSGLPYQNLINLYLRQLIAKKNHRGREVLG